MRHSKIDAILELIDGALAGYAAESSRGTPARAGARTDTTPARRLARAATSAH
jgi:hypothetical protein